MDWKKLKIRHGDITNIGSGNVVISTGNVTINQQQQYDIGQFNALMGQISQLVLAARLDEEYARLVQDDLGIIHAQLKKEKPQKAIIMAKLQEAAAFVSAGATAVSIVEKLIPLFNKAIDIARSIF